MASGKLLFKLGLLKQLLLLGWVLHQAAGVWLKVLLARTSREAYSTRPLHLHRCGSRVRWGLGLLKLLLEAWHVLLLLLLLLGLLLLLLQPQLLLLLLPQPLLLLLLLDLLMLLLGCLLLLLLLLSKQGLVIRTWLHAPRTLHWLHATRALDSAGTLDLVGVPHRLGCLLSCLLLPLKPNKTLRLLVSSYNQTTCLTTSVLIWLCTKTAHQYFAW